MIDAHAHLGRWLTDWVGRPGEWMTPDVPALLDVMDAHGVTTVVNLDGRWGAELQSNLDRYDHAHPGRFITFCHVDWADLPNLAASLTASVAAGARGLKVWKDLGLHVRDAAGALVLPDDPRLSDLWAAAASLGVPVFIHIADPIAFFDPVDDANELAALLRRRPDIDAVFVANDPMAIGALGVLQTAGRRVPDDVAVVGFDDVTVAASTTPPLTTVRQPVEEMGRAMMKMLLERIAGGGGDGRESLVVPTELIVRASA